MRKTDESRSVHALRTRTLASPGDSHLRGIQKLSSHKIGTGIAVLAGRANALGPQPVVLGQVGIVIDGLGWALGLFRQLPPYLAAQGNNAHKS